MKLLANKRIHSIDGTVGTMVVPKGGGSQYDGVTTNFPPPAPPPPKTISGKVVVCGQSDHFNCVAIDACYAINNIQCTSVLHDRSVGQSDKTWDQSFSVNDPVFTGGSKSQAPLQWGAYCQVSGFAAVPPGVKISVYSNPEPTCAASDLVAKVGEGGNCGSSQAGMDIQNAKCAVNEWADGSRGGTTVCSFQVEKEEGWYCPSS